MPEQMTSTIEPPSKRSMSQIPPSSPSPASSSNGNTASLRHVLEFEKPLAKLDQQIKELEALTVEKGIDYSTELHQLRTNYTSLLRKTYDNLTAWETVQDYYGK